MSEVEKSGLPQFASQRSVLRPFEVVSKGSSLPVAILSATAMVLGVAPNAVASVSTQQPGVSRELARNCNDELIRPRVSGLGGMAIVHANPAFRRLKPLIYKPSLSELFPKLSANCVKQKSYRRYVSFICGLDAKNGKPVSRRFETNIRGNRVTGKRALGPAIMRPLKHNPDSEYKTFSARSTLLVGRRIRTGDGRYKIKYRPVITNFGLVVFKDSIRRGSESASNPAIILQRFPGELEETFDVPKCPPPK